MLARGINVALGTDSCASSPNLNLLDDLRLVHELAPHMPMTELWSMVTIRAAKAIDAATSVGQLSPGLAADLVAFPAASDDPLRNILLTESLPHALYIGGVQGDLEGPV